MPTTPKPDARIVACPLCKTSFNREAMDRCPVCSADATYPGFDQLIEADAALAKCQMNYDDLIMRVNDLNKRWEQWQAHRAALVPLLEATRTTAPQPRASVAPHPDDQPVPASADATVTPALGASDAMAPSVPPVAAAPVAAAVMPAASARAAQPTPRERPPVERHTPRVLTAPVLLGVSGASLLIAAAVVFVAVTWETFFPLGQGLLVLAVAGGVGYLSLWLKRLTLVITSGAVGVVAMAFAGVAVIAFDREAQVLNAFAPPLAMLVVSAAGLGLARFGIRWVNASAALAVVLAAAGFTLAAMAEFEGVDSVVWAIVGAVLAGLVAATHQVWRGKSAAVMVKWGSLAWIVVSGLAVPVDLLLSSGQGVGVALAALVPIAVLVLLARWWAREVAGPAALLFTFATFAGASHLGASGSEQLAAVAVAVALVVLAGRWAPASVWPPLTIGLSLGFTAVAMGGVVGAVDLTGTAVATVADVAFLGQSWSGDAPDLWLGVAVLVGGLALAALRTWRARPEWLSWTPIIGAILVALGVGMVSQGGAVQVAGASVSALSIGMVAGGVVVAASMWLWDGVAARLTARVGSAALVSLAGIYGGVALTRAQGPWWEALLIALVPLVVLVTMAKWWPRVAVAPAVIVLTWVSGSLAAHFNASTWQTMGAVSLTVLVVVLAARWFGADKQQYTLVGLAPAASILGFFAVLTALMAIAVVLAGVEYSEMSAFSGWGDQGILWGGAATLLLGLAIAALRLWRQEPPVQHSVFGVGSALVVVGLAAVSGDGMRLAAPGLPGALAVGLSIAGLLMVVAQWLWEPEYAREWSRVSGFVVLTVSGIHAAFAYGNAQSAWWTALIVAMVPLLALLVLVRWWPRHTLGSAALLVTAIATAAVAHLDGSALQAAAAATLATAVVLWAGIRLPATWKPAIVWGLVPSLAWGLGVSVWSVAALLVRISALDSTVGLDLWATATTALTGTALAALAHWRLPKAVVSASSLLGAVIVVLGASTMTFTLADIWDVDSANALAGAGVVAALTAAAFVVLWGTSAARWTNGIGATALISLSGLNGAVALSRPGTALWLSATLTVAPIVLLVVFARWWPGLTLGPASVLIPVAAWAVGVRLEWSAPVPLLMAVAAGAAIAWGATLLAPRRRWHALSGPLAAALAGAVYALWLVPSAVAAVFAVETWSGPVWTARWGAATMLALAALLAAGRRLELNRSLATAAGVAGAVAMVGAAISATALVSVSVAQDSLWPAVAGMGASLLAAATWRVWADRAARWTAGLGALAWFTSVNILVIVDLTEERVPWWPAVATLAGAIAILVVCARWWPVATLGPAALVLSMGATGAVAGLNATWDEIHFAAAASLALLVWVAHVSPRRRSRPILAGSVPAAIITSVILLLIALRAIERLSEVVARQEPTSISLWASGTALAALLALMSWRPAREHAGWVALPLLFLASASAPVAVAWIATGVVAVVAAVLGNRARTTPEAAMSLAVIGVAWASGANYSSSLALAAAAAIAVWTAVQHTGARRTWTLVAGPLLAAAAAGLGVNALGGNDNLSLAVAMGVAVTMPVVAARAGVDEPMRVAPGVIAAATVLVPLAAQSWLAAGISLLVAGAAWLALSVLEWRPGRYISVAVLSAGTAMILADSNVQIIEAYTAVPAVGLLGVGLWWMYENPQVHSLRGLGPGLAMALVPSYVALVVQPESLLRTVLLTVATIVLALSGVLLRWFAPILATAITAVVVSVAQIVVGDNLTWRVVSFAVVGGVLMGLATTYERLKELR